MLSVWRAIDRIGNGIRDPQADSGEDHEFERAMSRIPREIDPTGTKFSHHMLSRPLHPVIRDEVYRIGREALANAFYHSQASNIEVELDYMGKQLRVFVRDDGCGIDEQVLRSGRDGHWGLPGMRGRAGSIGSTLKLWSRVPGGTEVELSVPGHVAFRSHSPHRKLRWLIWLRPRKGQLDNRKLESVAKS